MVGSLTGTIWISALVRCDSASSGVYLWLENADLFGIEAQQAVVNYGSGLVLEGAGAADDDIVGTDPVFAAGSTVFIGTGIDVGFQLTSDWHRYHPMTATWTTIAPMPATPRQYGTGFSVGGFGYVFGGVDAGGLSNELFVYLPVNGVWYALDTLPGMPRSGSASFVLGVRAFIVGAGMADKFYRERVDQHLRIGIRALEQLRAHGVDRLHSRKLRSFAEVAFQ